MDWVFGKPNEKEIQRKERREMRTATRELNLDYRQLEKKEKELEQQIKQLAKSGQNNACKLLAKQLIQLRNLKTKNIGTNVKITSISSKNRQAQSLNTMAKVMGTTASTMQNINNRMPVHKMASQMQDFEKQQALMDMKGDLIEETLDSMLEMDDDAEQSVIDQVLDEIGIETKQKLSQIPRVRDELTSISRNEISDNDLKKMLADLRN
ncbi:hypothetical protein Mgra_00002740 [Meloidogyne graminicola]|uniref:Uncharacterized protein n=1 Tax=Meloidogyne graminicola TaxID=189291 RepID=A0A8S9ZVY8_9BILA|nr:hypothetical protein Mgra_00002740 [Meloidogyne graminicola]